MIIIKPLPLAIALAISTPAIADSQNRNTKTFTLDKITVAATLTEQSLEDVANTVSIIDDEQIERQGATDIRDMVRYTPGVEVGSDGRFGLSGFTIRGMDDNRVKIILDGVQQAKSFSPGGDFQQINRNTVDIETLKKVEIVKGPASTLYGSDALGGVVSFTTKDADDFLNEQGDDSHIGLKAGYFSKDEQQSTTLNLANRTGNLDSLLIYTHRTSEEQESQGNVSGTGEDRTKSNPTDNKSDNLLAKLGFQLNDQHRIELVGEYLKSEVEIQQLSKDETTNFGAFGFPFAADDFLSYHNSAATDEYKRTRIGFEHQWQADNALFDDLQWSLNWQKTQSNQVTSEEVDASPNIQAMFHVNPGSRVKDYSHEEKSIQLQAQFNKVSGIHNLTYGFKYEDAETENTTLEFVNNLPTASGRYIPVVDAKSYGLFIQDQISLWDDQLVLTPGLRYDSFDYQANTDSLWDEPLKDHDSSKVSVKLGGVYKFNKTFSGFAQYSEGFKAPNVRELYYTRDGGTYLTLPNENLDPEESQSYEIGLRAKGAWGNAELVHFYNDYENFIETVVLNTNAPYTNGVSQAQNIAEAVIKGWELRSSLWLDEVIGAPLGTSFNLSMAYSEGEGKQSGQSSAPLNSIAPLKTVMGLTYENPNGSWGTTLNLTLVDGKDNNDIDHGTEALFAPDRYELIDLTAYYQVNEQLQFRAGIYNLTDEKYWVWGDVRGQEAGDTNLDRYTETGRNFSISASYAF
jgi:hemoglobin/transferrin/lactoferrin receptor protein